MQKRRNSSALAMELRLLHKAIEIGLKSSLENYYSLSAPDVHVLSLFGETYVYIFCHFSNWDGAAGLNHFLC